MNRNLELEIVLLNTLNKKMDRLTENMAVNDGFWGGVKEFQGLIGGVVVAIFTLTGGIGGIMLKHRLDARAASSEPRE